MGQKRVKKFANSTSFCQLCLAIGRNLVVIDPETNATHMELTETILDLLDVRVRRSSQSLLCSPCISFLKCFRTFKEMTKKAQILYAKYQIKPKAGVFPTLEVPHRINSLKDVVDKAEDILRHSATINAEYYKTVYDLNEEPGSEISEPEPEPGGRVKEEAAKPKEEIHDEELLKVVEVLMKEENMIKEEVEESNWNENDQVLDDEEEERITQELETKLKKDAMLPKKRKREENSKIGKPKAQKNEKPKVKKNKRRIYKCDICQKMFNEKDLQYHMNVHLKIHPFKCDICGRKFTDPYRVTTHQRIEHRPTIDPADPSDKMYQCELCERIFPVRKNLWDHEKQFHNETRACEECNEIFPNYYRLKLHQNKKHKQKYPCELCGKEYFKTQLKYHMNGHLNIKPYACNYEGCTMRYSDPGRISTHKQLDHLKITRYVCKVCGKEFKTKSDHDAHWNVHEKKPPIPCDVCGKFFSTKKTLRSHVVLHKGERNHVCKFEGCGKGFTSSSVLRIHTRTHTKETPYTCLDCDRKFTYRNLYKLHAKNVHGRIL